MDAAARRGLIRQHLIDPEVCIRCNTCEATCPINAITHDDRNYVVDAAVCNGCMACISPCPTGAIDHWRSVLASESYSLEDQLRWDTLPLPLVPDEAASALTTRSVEGTEPTRSPSLGDDSEEPSLAGGATLPPWSAAHPYVNLYGPRSPATAAVALNINCTEGGAGNETHHLVLDFGTAPFLVLEGQSLGILPPGADAQGRAHRPRLYSIASPRDGERSARNHVALTVKRVTEDCEGRPVCGVASNYLCDLSIGDTVRVIGPFGTAFLMPNHEPSNLIMICTGTGSAPMRAMTEWRRKLHKRGNCPAGKLMLFFGARSPRELPYHGPLQTLSRDFIDVNLAYSRTPGTSKTYVQDLMRERREDLGELLNDPQTYIYVCGITRMEEGVLLALREAAERAGMDWNALCSALRREGRLHVETY